MYAAIERSPLTDEEKAPLFAECVILRAYYYYILTINFGDVPYYFDEVTIENSDAIARLPRMSADELRKILIEELWYWLAAKSETTEDGRQCRQALSYIKTYDPLNQYRIGAMVGCVIGGKLAMWNKDWDRAIAFFKYIEDVYGYIDPEANVGDGAEEEGGYLPINALMGYKLSDVKFSKRYTDESIFEIPGTAKDYGYRDVHHLAAYCTPPRSNVVVTGDEDDESLDLEDPDLDLSKKEDMYNGIRIPELGKNSRTLTPYRPTWYFCSRLMPAGPTKDLQGNEVAGYYDKRRSTYDPANFSTEVINEVEDGGGYLAWCWAGWTKEENMATVPRHMMWFNSSNGTGKRPFLGDKFWCPGMVYTQDSNHLKIFRFAHVILDLAECHCRMGNLAVATQYLNATKKRAGIIELAPLTEEEFMDELMAESARELFGEYTRRHNLVRWGVWSEQVSTWANNSKLRANAQKLHRKYYPIPESQVILSGYALDNKAYDEAGDGAAEDDFEVDGE
jgi:hypothetical protein